MGGLKGALYARMEEMSFRSGAAVAGAGLAVAGTAIALVVVLSGHTAGAARWPLRRCEIGRAHV